MILAKKKQTNIHPDDLIADRVKSNKLSSLLVIVPTNRKSRSLRKELIYASGGKVTGKINIETLGTFSRKIYSGLNPLPLQFLSEAAAAVLLKKCFNTRQLKYFNQYKTDVPSGTLSRIKNIISEYKRHAVTPDHLDKEAEKLESSEKLKAADISLIYRLYNEECRKNNSGEMGDIYEGILKYSQPEFKDIFYSVYPEVDLVIINGFDEFTVPEVEIINRIAAGPELFLAFDYNSSNPGLFLHLQESFRLFTARGFTALKEFRESGTNNFRDLVRNEYFNGGRTVKQNGYNIKELVGLDKEKEVELIAREIKQLLNNGTAANRICVVFNLIQNYSPVIRDKFPRYGIPFNLTDRIPLSSSGPVTAIITFLEILENNFYYKNIFRSLSSGYIKLKDVSLSDMMVSASELKIISGYDNWVNTISEAVPFALNNKRISYNRALESVNYLHGILSPLSGKLNISGFRANLLKITGQLDITRNIIDFSGETEPYIRALSSFYDIINELFQLLLSEYGADKKFALPFFLDQIRTAADNSRFNISEKPGYGVQVTNLDEIRGLNYDYLFVGGMTDGELPTRYTPEIFFSGSYLREEWRHQVEERYRFYQSLCTWEKGLYLTRALQEENKELVPSNFLAELKNHFVMEVKTEKDFSDTVYSREELQEYAGVNISSPEVFSKPGMPDAGRIKKIIEIYEQRRNEESESNYNGYIYSALSDEMKNILEKAVDKEYSASQLEVYALCPFKYFLERILYLNIPEEPAEEMESLELGSLIHKILYKFYKSINEKGIVLFNCSQEDFRTAEEIMFTCADRVIGELAGKSPVNFLEIEKLKGLNSDRKKSVLYNFLAAEREKDDGYIPFDFEVPFGNINEEGEDNRKSAPFYSGKIKLRGKIDRMDVDHKGQKIQVIDYKLGGKKPTLDDLEKGISLQLPLYLYAASVIIKKELRKEYQPAGADIYSLKYQEKTFGRKPVLPARNKKEDELIEEYYRIIEICRDSINRYVDSISKGKFNLSSLEEREKKACIYCNFNSICRIGEIK